MTEDETLRLDLLKYAGGDIKRADEYYAWVKQAPPIVTAQPEPVADGLTLEEGGDVSGRGWVEPPLDPMTMAREEFFEEPGEHEQAGLPREDFYNDPPVDEQCQTEPVLSADYHDEASASSEPPSEEDVRSEPPASDEGSGDQIANADEPLDLAALTRAAQAKLDALEERTTEGWVGVSAFDWSSLREGDIVEARYEDGFCERLLFAGYTPVTREPEWVGTRADKATHLRVYLKPDLNADDEIDLLADEELEDA